MAKPRDKLALAKRHIAKAAIHNGISTTKSHPSRVAAAAKLRDEFGLPDVEALLRDLNDIRKSEAYGEELSAERDAQDVIDELDEFVAAVQHLVSESTTDD